MNILTHHKKSVLHCSVAMPRVIAWAGWDRGRHLQPQTMHVVRARRGGVHGMRRGLRTVSMAHYPAPPYEMGEIVAPFFQRQKFETCDTMYNTSTEVIEHVRECTGIVLAACVTAE